VPLRQANRRDEGGQARSFYLDATMLLAHHLVLMRWKEAALAAGVFFLSGVAYFWARSVGLPMLRGPEGHYVLSDPDSFMRWRVVEEPG
jgi:hypothetical protein